MSEEPKKLSDEERFQLDRPPEEEEGPTEHREPTWQDLAQGYIRKNSTNITDLEERLTILEKRVTDEIDGLLNLNQSLTLTVRGLDARLTELEDRKHDKEA